MMPGGSKAAYDAIEHIVSKVAAQVDGPCVTYIGKGGSGNFVKMVHNGIEYGDMQVRSISFASFPKVGAACCQVLSLTWSHYTQARHGWSL